MAVRGRKQAVQYLTGYASIASQGMHADTWNYCFNFQLPERSSDIRRRALFVTRCAAWRWDGILLVGPKEETPLAAIVVAIEQRARRSGCHPLNADSRTDNKCRFVQPACIILAYGETLAAQAAFNIPNGLSCASRTRAWLRGWQMVMSKRSVPRVLRSPRISGLSQCLPYGRSSTTGLPAALARSVDKN